MTRLPASVDELRGLRAARWIRESSKDQADRFGPDSQRRAQDDAIARFGLVDTGAGWDVSHSGYRKRRDGTAAIASTTQWREMLAAAGETYDVLLVGYVSRFARDLRAAVNARHDLHAAGAALLFADERILSSDEIAWDAWARETVESESYSRRLGRRIRDAYAAKRSSQRDPGGSPPWGFLRDSTTKLLEADPDRLATVRRAYELAAGRATDRAVAVAIGLPIDTVRGILTSPLYVGRLRTGERAHWPAVVDRTLWEQVQAARARRRTRDGRPGLQPRPYGLTMLHCAGCGRHLIGDTGRYRHVAPCAAFTAVRREPRRRVQGQRKGQPGHSYRAAEYEAIVRDVLADVALGADRVERMVALTREPEPDHLALARIGRERDAAMVRYRRDRNARVLEATMVALDEQEAEAAAVPVTALPAADVVELLADLPALWDGAPNSRRALAEALFERIEVLGLRRMRIVPTRAALDSGLAEAFSSASAGYGRGGGTRADGTRQIRGCRVTVEGGRPAIAAVRSA